MSMELATWNITTEGDCEGRTIKQLGNFRGTKHQAIAYLKVNGIEPVYKYTITKVDVVDVADIPVGDFRVTTNSHGQVITMTGVIPAKLVKQVKLQKLLADLSEDDKTLLGDHYYEQFGCSDCR